MSTLIEAEYIAAENVLKLSAPLEGVEDHAQLEVEIRHTAAARAEQPWMKLAGSLSGEMAAPSRTPFATGLGETKLRFEVLAIDSNAAVDLLRHDRPSPPPFAETAALVMPLFVLAGLRYGFARATRAGQPEEPRRRQRSRPRSVAAVAA